MRISSRNRNGAREARAVYAISEYWNYAPDLPDVSSVRFRTPVIAATPTSGRRGAQRGLLVLPDNGTNFHRESICALAERYRLPAIYPFRRFITSGGLTYYGADSTDMYRKLADYVDRIFRGAQPGDLPVQTPTKFELILNLRTAKILGLAISASVLARTNEVVE